jgi:dihydrolipoamide dehydrogenase
MSDTKNFDVVVIGGGPGGYIAAIRAAQLGFSVACVDEWTNAKGGPAPGGTCTNVGCIPSKALLQSSEHFEQAGHSFAEHGIDVAGLSLNLPQMLKRKDQVVKQNNEGILYLFKKNKVTFFHGRATFAAAADGAYTLSVTGPGAASLSAKHVIVATGSNARELPGAPFDEQVILSNAGALAIDAVPGKLGEGLPTFLGAVDEQIAKEAHKLFTKQGLKISLGVKIGTITKTGSGVTVEYTDAAGAAQKGEFDRLIISIGRVPNTIGLGAEVVGLALDERGFVNVDAECKTNLRGPMLAHKAEEEGVAVAERIAGQHGHVNFNTIPWVIYTHPEIAWVGQTEQQLKAAGTAYKAGTFPFLANGRARALGDTSGMVKFLADATTDEILGVHIVGPSASELISEAVVAMEFRASAEDIARICHAHPSLSEATKEAALAVDKRALNF